MPGTVGGFVYPLSTDAFNLPTDMQTLANQIDLRVGGSALYWSGASARSNGSASNRIMSHNGTVTELVDSSWTVNPESYLIVDSSTDTGLRWGLDYIPSTEFIAAATVVGSQLSFSSIPQGYQNLSINMFTQDTSRGLVFIATNDAISNQANQLATIGIGAGSIVQTGYWNGGGTNVAGYMEMTVYGYSRGNVPVVGSGGTVSQKLFSYRSVTQTGSVQIGSGRLTFPASTALYGYSINTIRYTPTAGTAIMRIYGIK